MPFGPGRFLNCKICGVEIYKERVYCSKNCRKVASAMRRGEAQTFAPYTIRDLVGNKKYLAALRETGLKWA